MRAEWTTVSEPQNRTITSQSSGINPRPVLFREPSEKGSRGGFLTRPRFLRCTLVSGCQNVLVNVSFPPLPVTLGFAAANHGIKQGASKPRRNQALCLVPNTMCQALPLSQQGYTRPF
ncbi:uncharacterized protein PV07_12661 [Cladophialophora immunda]|uniref:Uncharacterized protein n=1 Tax=Cladophialophora immunda TaxID=569365 RepID=A0A0D2BSA1_9EURO|nr:uncharacterized protein PV07_12661 [Cladophialophora immunda]KIW21928.1 hypothetical protein PV07_12661 [Cladophialophora immunda]